MPMAPNRWVKAAAVGSIPIANQVARAKLLGRFPVTLYKEQWLKLLDMSADIRAFIAANEAQLKAKD